MGELRRRKLNIVRRKKENKINIEIISKDRIVKKIGRSKEKRKINVSRKQRGEYT